MSECFDDRVFGDLRDSRSRRAWLDTLLERQLIKLGVAHRLSEAELSKLALACRGDINRLLGRVEERRREFEAVKHDLRSGRVVLMNADHLAAWFIHGPFLDEHSFFQKTLKK